MANSMEKPRQRMTLLSLWILLCVGISLVRGQNLTEGAPSVISYGNRIQAIQAITPSLYVIAVDPYSVILVNRTAPNQYTPWITFYGHTNTVFQVINVGNVILSVGYDGLLIMNNWITNAATNYTFPGYAYDMALDTSNTTAYVAGTKDNSYGYVWAINIANGTIMWEAMVASKAARRMLYDNGTLWVGSWDRTIYRVNATNGAPISSLTSHTLAISYLYQNATHLWSGAEDNTVKLWLKTSTSPLATYTGASSRISGIDTNNGWLYSLAWDSYMRIYQGLTTTMTYNVSTPALPSAMVRIPGPTLGYVVGMDNGRVIELSSNVTSTASSASSSTQTSSTTASASSSGIASITSSTTPAGSMATADPSSNAPNNAANDKMSAALIPAAAAGGGVVLIAASALAYFFYRKRQQALHANKLRNDAAWQPGQSAALTDFVGQTNMLYLSSFNGAADPTTISHLTQISFGQNTSISRTIQDQTAIE